MKMFISIKRKLSKYFFGRIIIRIYHFLIAIPLTKLYSFKFNLIKKDFKAIKFYSINETFEMIKNEKKSLCRYGDGEISWIYGDSKGHFGQENSVELSNRLRSIFTCENKDIMIGIPDFFGSLDHYTKKHKESRNAHLAKYHKRWMELIETNKTYADALITRVYYGRTDHKSKYLFEQWKNLWKDKNVIVIEGSQTRFGVGNDLLNSSHSVKRIIAPAENAFQMYKEILNISKENISDDVLFLVSLGPTATVLAFDIGTLGGQAIDIGHLDIEYEWYLAGINKKKPVIGKYVNEAGGASINELPDNILKKYESEIIKIIV